MKEVSADHTRIDRGVAEVFASRPHQKPCCRAGCSACCSEAVYASQAEALHIVESLTPDQIAEVKARLVDWLARTSPVMKQNFPDAMRYRRLEAPCVLLKDGLCSVYPRRPMGCRTWFALENPENCNLPQREHQRFAFFPIPLMARWISFTAVNDLIITDHLGNLLAEILLGVKTPSGSREVEHVSQFKGQYVESTAEH